MAAKNSLFFDLQTKLIGVAFGVICSVVTLVWLAYTTAKLFSGGRFLDPLDSVYYLLTAKKDSDLANHTLLLVFLGMWTFIAIIVGVYLAGKLSTYKTSGTKLLKDIESREGIATRQEVAEHVGGKTLAGKGKILRPTLKEPRLEDLGLKLGKSQGKDVWISTEDTLLLIGPPRSGKGFNYVINAINTAPGAVITTSTRMDNWVATVKLREKIGPVMLFDPQNISNLKSEFKWAVYQGCENPEIATARAKVLIANSAMGESQSNQEWAAESENILRVLLHAAALGKVHAGELGSWAQTPNSSEEAIEIIREHPNGSKAWATILESTIQGDSKMLASKWMGVASTLSALTLPDIAELFSPGPGDKELDPEEFIQNKGTLYLIGTKTGAGAVAPYLIALMDSITQTARQIALRSPGNRLDPPLSLILDEIANMAIWPELPIIMADGGGVGISTSVVLQSLSQAKKEWSQEEADTIFAAANYFIQLGGAKQVSDLEDLSKIMGQRTEQKTNYSYGRENSYTRNEQDTSVVTLDELRLLPFGSALLLAKNMRPGILRMKPWIEQNNSNQVKQGKEQAERMLFKAAEEKQREKQAMKAGADVNA